MPLVTGKKAATQAGKSENIRRLSHEIGHSPHVQSREQAIAIAMSTARRAIRKKKQDGGDADLPPEYQPNPGEAFRVMPPINAEGNPNPYPLRGGADLEAGKLGMGNSIAPIPNSGVSNWPPPKPAPTMRFGSSQYPLQSIKVYPDGAGPFQQSGGTAGGGGQRQLPLRGPPGAGAREHAFQGPLNTHTPGRTDRHNINVKSGSYVIPADIVSATGEGNTLAGNAIIHMLFPPVQVHGSAPHPPAGVKVGHAEGGEVGKEAPIIAAGGEIVLAPEQIISDGSILTRKYGINDLDQAHEWLDDFVKETRKREIERLKHAPPPKK